MRIGGKPRAVGLVIGKTVDVVGGIGGGQRAFVRREVADKVAAATRDDLTELAAILRKRLALERVDLVANEARDRHGNSPCKHGSTAAEALADRTVLDWRHRTSSFRY